MQSAGMKPLILGKKNTESLGGPCPKSPMISVGSPGVGSLILRWPGWIHKWLAHCTSESHRASAEHVLWVTKPELGQETSTQLETLPGSPGWPCCHHKTGLGGVARTTVGLGLTQVWPGPAVIHRVSEAVSQTLDGELSWDKQEG